MKQRLEQMTLIAIAIVSGITPFTNIPAATGLALAALNLVLAFFAQSR
jgi:precorrin-2 methylase